MIVADERRELQKEIRERPGKRNKEARRDGGRENKIKKMINQRMRNQFFYV